MIILSIKTDQPESEFGLYDDHKQQSHIKYLANRELGQTIHIKIKELLKGQKKDWTDIGGIVCFQGPGSFTGLRIGLSVANALSEGLNIPVVGTKGDNWTAEAINELLKGRNDKAVYPFYGAEPNITKPKK